MEKLDFIFGDGYLPESGLPPALSKIRAQLREAGPVDEDPVRSALARARIGQLATGDGRKVVNKLLGEESEEVDAVARGRLAKAGQDLTVEGIERRALLSKLLGDSEDVEVPARGAVLQKADPTWSQLLAPASSNARLDAPQRHGRLEPERAPGEPLAHPDGAVTRSWPEGSTTVIWKDGKIIGCRTEYQSADGTEVEFYDGTGDEITEGEYARLVA